MKRLDGKVAIITGATSGIGQASAELFAAEGAKVVVVGRNKERGQKVVDGIKGKGGEATFVAVDMLNADDFDNLLRTTIDTYGKLDILFNNAGVAVSGPLETFKDEDWDFVVKTNLRAPYQLCKKAMPYLIRTKGNILNTASMSGLRADSNGFAYNPSKAGLVMLTQVIAKDFAGVGVRCNAICPGITETPILGTVEATQMEALRNAIPLKRMAQPIDIANAAVFLVSDEASYITGAALPVDGGITI